MCFIHYQITRIDQELIIALKLKGIKIKSSTVTTHSTVSAKYKQILHFQIGDVFNCLQFFSF